jgi:F0F1-type ATP synthase delta subunit
MARITVVTDQMRRTALRHISITVSVWQEVISLMRVVSKSKVCDRSRRDILVSSLCEFISV